MNRLFKELGFVLVLFFVAVLFLMGCNANTTVGSENTTNLTTTNEVTTESPTTTLPSVTQTTEEVSTDKGIDYAENEEDYITRSYLDGVEIIAYTGSDENIKIPWEIGGETVLKVGNYAFYKNTVITIVALSENITEIGDYAFSNAINLEILDLPASLNEIGEDIILNCNSLEQINVDNNNDSFFSADGVLFRTVPSGGVTQLAMHIYSMPLEEEENSYELLLYPQGITDTYYEIDSGIQAIGEYAFKGNQYLTEIVIPSSVVEIRTGAFMNCTSLETLAIPGSVEVIPAFMCYGCSALNDLTLSEGLLTIERSAFRECASLDSLSFPNSLTEIGTIAFSYIGAIQQVYLHDNLHLEDGSVFISNQNFVAYVINPSNMRYQVIDGVLYSYDLSELISYPSGKLGTSYEVNSQTDTIYNGAFEGNLYLEEISFAGPINSIGQYSFSYCQSLTSFEIPELVSNLGMYTFYASEAIEEFTVHPDNLYFVAVDGVIFDNDISDLYFYPPAKTATLYVIPNTVTNILSLAFFDNLYIENIVIPENLEVIGGGVFSSMKSLDGIDVAPGNTYFTSVDGVLYSSDLTILYQVPSGRNIVTFSIPANVTTLYYGAFQGMQYVEYLIIPNTVQSIMAHSFRDCPNLEYIVIPPDLSFISGNLITGSTNVVVYFLESEDSYEFYHSWNLDNRPYYFLGEWSYDINNVPQITGSD